MSTVLNMTKALQTAGLLMKATGFAFEFYQESMKMHVSFSWAHSITYYAYQCSAPLPLYGTRLGLVGDLINEYCSLMIFIVLINAQIPYQA